ncbi:cytochrome P450 family protein [Kutzneria chonburiensis]|uniref:Cytochrome P450 n=1 Tax=Kutzneria chonburiensis TaxID=1483604 RepID=A0ABV6MK12_9PSEU|nr:cytochrome P450 [Kutzneria chonburiensis]
MRTELFSDARALTAELGDPGPVHRITLPDGMPSWLVTGYHEVRAALSDPRVLRSVEHAAPELRGYFGLAGDDFVLSRHMLFADPPDHTRLRRLVVKAFTPRRVELLRPRISELVDELLDELSGRSEADLVAELAQPLPAAVICELLGIPAGDRPEFLGHADVLIGVNASTEPGDLIQTGQWFDRYFTELIADRRRRPGSDLISGLLAAQDNDDRLTDIEVRSNSFLLLNAGFETTVNLIANTLLLILTHPDALADLYADPTLVPAAVEEALRVDSPVSTITYRFAAEPLTIGGVHIAAGEHIAVSLPAANLDEARFRDPHTVHIGRSDNHHVSFGFGMHYCVGAQLARLEGQLAVGRLLARFTDLTLSTPVSQLRWKPSFIVHHLHELPVTYKEMLP